MQNQNQTLERDDTSSASRKSKKSRVIKLVNHLLQTCLHLSKIKSRKIYDIIPIKIQLLSELKPHFYVHFYEILCDSQIIDKIWPPVTDEDHIHNTQAVIDSLSLDVLHEDLSYLTGEAVCKPHLTSVEYLLEILKSLHEWIDSEKNKMDFKENNNKIDRPKEDFQKIEKRDSLKPDCKTEKVQVQVPIQVPAPVQGSGDKLEEKIQICNTETPVLETKTTFSKLNLEVESGSEDVFKMYMRQKEQEYKEIREKSSSGNSSLSLQSDQDDLINLVNNQDGGRKLRKEKRESIDTNKIEPSIETINNELELIRNSLKRNLEINNNTSDWIKQMYENNFQTTCDKRQSEMNKVNQESELTREMLLKAFSKQGQPRTNLKVRPSSQVRGVLLPRSKSLVDYSKLKRECDSTGSFPSNQSETTSNPRDLSKKLIGRNSFLIGENGIMNALLEEFPYLNTTSQTMSYLWQRHSKQIEMLNRSYNEFKDRLNDFDLKDANNVSEQIENKKFLHDAYFKQAKLIEIMRNDLEHYERTIELKRNKAIENSVKANKREERFKNARIKRYVKEFRQEHRARMLKQTTNEELIFKRLFDECLKLQKERMLEMKKYSQEKCQLMMRDQLNKIHSIENGYKNKLDLFNEKFQSDKKEAELRERAQSLVLSKAKLEIKNKLEGQVRNMQDLMSKDQDFLHWRQMDADLAKVKVQKADYLKQKH